MEHTVDPSAATAALARVVPPAADVREQLERMLSGAALRLSARRRDLLRFLVEETLEGRSDRLKGFTVATAVFGRDGSFDPSSDPVVRLEARRLRSDLDSYYVDAGNRDPVRITIPKGGYVPHFEWQVRGADPEETPGPPAEEPAATAAAGGGRRVGRVGVAAVAAVLLVAALVGAWLWRDRLAPADEARGPSLVVLPFAVISPDDGDRLLAAGMTQEVIAQLMRVPAVRLFSAPASFAQDPSADARELGRRLGTSYVVQGTIRSEDALVHVRAMLTDAATGEVLWNGAYDRLLSPGDIFTVQEQIASEIATTLGQTYGVMASHETDRAPAPSISSYACVLRAQDYRRTFDEGQFAPTLACLQAAVARDPDYADAWAMLGWLHLDAGRFDIVPDRERSYELALESASRAIGVDPDNTLALKALGSIYHYTGRFDESVAAMRKALAINPDDPDAMAQLGWRLAVRGDFSEGIPYLRRAIDRTLSPPGWYFHFIAIDDYLKGDYAAMLADAERSAVDGSATSLSLIAIAQGALGDKAEARATLDKLAAAWPGFLQDPEAAYRVHQPTEALLQTMLAGLRNAG
ncbi:MAG TPA: tetratricopeptide repeat protein, partial [Amaricoccus sp.]|nr:tetratricopeptide repeat protein [Amaricoccus sp.]